MLFLQSSPALLYNYLGVFTWLDCVLICNNASCLLDGEVWVYKNPWFLHVCNSVCLAKVSVTSITTSTFAFSSACHWHVDLRRFPSRECGPQSEKRFPTPALQVSCPCFHPASQLLGLCTHNSCSGQGDVFKLQSWEEIRLILLLRRHA